MAITYHLLESFDDGNHASRYSSASSTGLNGPAARTGSSGFRMVGGGFGGNATWLHTGSQVAGTAFWFYSNGVPTGRFWAWEESSTVHVDLAWSGSDLLVRRAGSTTLATVTGALPANGSGIDICTWIDVHDSTGAVKLWVDGVLRVNISGVDTRNGGTGVVNMNRGGFGAETNIDDLVIMTGSSFADADVRHLQIYTRIINGNGNYSQLVGSDGNSVDNYLNADEATPSASDYNGSATPGDKDSYTKAALGVTGVVHAFTIATNALKSGVDPIGYRPFVRRNSVDGAGTDVTLTTSIALNDQIFTTDPTDSSALDVTKVDAMEIGFEVRTV